MVLVSSWVVRGAGFLSVAASHAKKYIEVMGLYSEKKNRLDQICEMMEISKPTLCKYIEVAESIEPTIRTTNQGN